MDRTLAISIAFAIFGVAAVAFVVGAAGMYRVMERSGLLDGAGIGTYASYSRSEKDVRTDKFWDELRDPRSRLDRRLIVFGGGGFVTVVAIGILWMQAVGPAMVAAAA